MGGRKVVPIEVKSGLSSRHASLDGFVERNGKMVGEAYVVHGSDLGVDGRLIHIPVYMTGAFRRVLSGDLARTTGDVP